jgi:hypothetical protein
MFEELIRMIEEHATYGPALAVAVSRKLPLVLNYHTHGGEEAYCVSICTKMGYPVPFFENLEGALEELAHIKSFGRTAADCVPLTSVLSAELYEHFRLEGAPELYLNGKPLVASP